MAESAIVAGPTDHPTVRTLLSGLDWYAGATVLSPEEPVPGSWVGGPSAVQHEGVLHLAYRRRRPIGAGRGFANVIARSTDGLTFETVTVIERERHRAESLERPCLVHLDDGRWRLYISCATPNSKHWRIDLLEAATIAELPDARPTTVLPGDATVGVKDPVIVVVDGRWHLWASCHPLDEPEATDRMVTRRATSVDGVSWRWAEIALVGTPGTWDARGVRFTSVIRTGEGWLAFYDGRANADENWEERTGVAISDHLEGPWTPLPGPVFASPLGAMGLRYLSVVPVAGPRLRIYYESTRADGSHELRTQLLS